MSAPSGEHRTSIHMSKPDQGYPLWRKTTPVRVDAATLRLAEQHIESCEACNPLLAEVPFEYVLDYLTGCDPEITDYILPGPGRCPRCNAAIRAKNISCGERFHSANVADCSSVE